VGENNTTCVERCVTVRARSMAA